MTYFFPECDTETFSKVTKSLEEKLRKVGYQLEYVLSRGQGWYRIMLDRPEDMKILELVQLIQEEGFNVTTVSLADPKSARIDVTFETEIDPEFLLIQATMVQKVVSLYKETETQASSSQ